MALAAEETPIDIPVLQIADIELPPEMERLRDLAYDLWWSWSPQATRLFTWIDPEHWAALPQPRAAPHQRGALSVAAAAGRPGVPPHVRRGDPGPRPSTARGRGGSQQHAERLPGPVAYFSMEFGLHESLACTRRPGGTGRRPLQVVQRSRRAARGRGAALPLRLFPQTVDADGFQQHIYPDYDFARLPSCP
jgi:starch phosphorylase